MKIPTPLHGWRVFLGEVAVIVLGVLIALGAEQLVQAYDWHQRVERGRAALRSEIGEAAAQAQRRIDFGPCANERLNVLDALIMDSGPTLAQPMIATRYYTIISTWSQSVWETMTNSGVVERLPETEMLAYADLYESIALVKQEMTAEQDSISDLALMTRLRGRFDDSTRVQLLVASGRARRLNNTIIRDSHQIIEQAASLHISPSQVPASVASASAYQGCPSLLTRVPGVPQ